MYTMVWKVFGREGHRQRMSFGESFYYDFSDNDGVRILEILNQDKTGTNDYSIFKITMCDREKCLHQLDAQICDGVFEDCNTGKIELISEYSA